MSLAPLPDSLPQFLSEYLPPEANGLERPFLTLTYAQSMDSRISAKAGEQTKISHPETKTMTHYLRSKHDGIMVGIGTVLADDPKLNCRFKCDKQGCCAKTPRPIILDPHGKWDYAQSALHRVCRDGQGLAPYIIVDKESKPKSEDIETLRKDGGTFIYLLLCEKLDRSQNWKFILSELFSRGIRSLMVEGGAVVINDLLQKPEFVDSLIITVGAVFLGREGVQISPRNQVSLKDVRWWTGVRDAVLCGRMNG